MYVQSPRLRFTTRLRASANTPCGYWFKIMLRLLNFYWLLASQCGLSVCLSVALQIVALRVGLEA